MTSRTLCVIGLGYIGLPTAVVLADNGWQVTGVDVSDRTVDMVKRGELPFVEVGLEKALKKVVDAGTLTAQKDTPHSEIYIVSVPTPFKGQHELDASYIDAATDAIIPQLQGDELMILESTSPPGTTERMAKRVLAARPDLSADGADGKPVVHFAHAPERVLPGRIMIEMTSNDRIIGGLTPEATRRAKEVYESFNKGDVITTDARTAEMAKLTENAFRDVNIAFANELSVICEKLGINVWELIELSNHHPRVNILNPGPGVGGHCIAVDPWFIVSSQPEESKLIRMARDINDGKPLWVIDHVAQALADIVRESGKTQDAKIAVLGLAYKPNIDDLRESPSLEIAKLLAERYPQHEIVAVEPYVEELPKALEGYSNITFAEPHAAVEDADIVLVLVAHDQFKDLKPEVTEGAKLIDTIGLWR
ncbi:MAG: UDP-N-acetyl-D-mannosamine dehydrogenase [Actinomycetaceae bacterium]|nr:UDP-N-acetyl-D-mannosamine dehydrogenase [Arcanobacterium sp.]MDD7504599.1 UDP-N-acetyl-D-mannosamine dehydrogenase [Actinomycetaceae bacterium]MDY6143086.1 UDP-N-acetyl-D-mannosamine dehydrogenase [Arcanobacterium sp.]